MFALPWNRRSRCCGMAVRFAWNTHGSLASPVEGRRGGGISPREQSVSARGDGLTLRGTRGRICGAAGQECGLAPLGAALRSTELACTGAVYFNSC
ncbi:hypothetical protein C2L64_45155 [Paraburkholderia hospita]|uniref:Uncharacterized protein n=1 Tax=Paraburkholderia hospita TaxID=169430 RepID=A0AAN1MQA0_9BURK|nr:hypothetical protein C2L64_45155 [Paraburkholderia hospita]